MDYNTESGKRIYEKQVSVLISVSDKNDLFTQPSVGKYHLQYLKTPIRTNFDSGHLAYSLANCEPYVGKDFLELTQSGGNIDLILTTTIQGGSSLDVEVIYPQETMGRLIRDDRQKMFGIDITKEQETRLYEMLEKHLGTTVDAYMAEELVNQFMNEDIQKIRMLDKENGTTSKLPEKKDYYIYPKKISGISNGKDDESVDLKIDCPDTELILRRAYANGFLEFTGKKDSFEEHGRKADIIATVSKDDEIELFVTGEDFIQPLKVPTTNEEKNRIRALVSDYINVKEIDTPVKAATTKQADDKSAGMPTTAFGSHAANDKPSDMPTKSKKNDISR